MRNWILLRRFLKPILAVAIALLIVFLGLDAAIAQSAAKSPVVLDGQPLFQVSAFEQVSAQERANLINLQLKEAIQASEPMQVRLEERNRSPTIVLNNRYLLTVTQQDTISGNTPNEQANRWMQQLQTALQQAQAERSTAYLRQTVFVAIGLVILTAVVHRLFGWLERQCSRVLLQRLSLAEADDPSAGTAKLIRSVFKLVLAIARTGLWIITALYIANLFPFSRQWSYHITSILIASFTSPILTLGNRSYTVINLLILAVLLSGWVILAGALTDLLRSRILSFAGINRGLQEGIAVLARYSLLTIGALVVLQVWGLDISSLAILASGLGLGIGLGLQNIAKNFSSGVVLVFERPIQVGDFVEVADLKGTVERIGGRSTEIRTLDQVSIIVPNSRFLEMEVINWSHGNPVSRLHLPVGVAYGSNPKVVQAALLEAARSHPNVLQSPPPDVLFIGFGDSALDFELLVWTAEPNKQFLLKSDLFFRIYEVFTERQIEIPFPQRDLHLRSGALSFPPQLESALIQFSEKFSNGQGTDAAVKHDQPFTD